MRALTIGSVMLLAGTALAQDNGRVLVMDQAALDRLMAPIPKPAAVVTLETSCAAGDRGACTAAAGFYASENAVMSVCPPLARKLYARACRLGDKASCVLALKRRLRRELTEMKRAALADLDERMRGVSMRDAEAYVATVRRDVANRRALYEEVSSPGAYDERECAGAKIPPSTRTGPSPQEILRELGAQPDANAADGGVPRDPYR